MIYLFVPYYTPPTEGFKQSLNNQVYKNFKITWLDRMSAKVLWTEACNQFYKEMEWEYYHGYSYNLDVVGIMNADISFGKYFLTEAAFTQPETVRIPPNNTVSINWRNKIFYNTSVYACAEHFVHGFYGRAFFMTVKDFISVGKFDSKIPHYLSDLDYSLRAIKKGLKPVIMKNDIYHAEHEYEKNTFSLFSPLSNRNPIIWTRFLLKHCPKRYLPINLLKTWMEVFKW